MIKIEEYLLVSFNSSHEAIEMEDTMKNNGIKGRLIPLSSKIKAGCGLAYKCNMDFFEQLKCIGNNYDEIYIVKVNGIEKEYMKYEK